MNQLQLYLQPTYKPLKCPSYRWLISTMNLQEAELGVPSVEGSAGLGFGELGLRIAPLLAVQVGIKEAFKCSVSTRI